MLARRTAAPAAGRARGLRSSATTSTASSSPATRRDTSSRRSRAPWPTPAATPTTCAWPRSGEHGAASGNATARAKSVLACAVFGVPFAPGGRARHHPRAPGHAGHRRRRGRHPGRPGDRRRRQAGLPRRAAGHHRRPHGHVRQDLPHARLRGLHPDAQDGRRRPARADRAAHLLRGRARERRAGQLQGPGPQEGAPRGRGGLRGLQRLPRRLPGAGAERVRRRHRAAQGCLHAVSRRPCPTPTSSTSPPAPTCRATAASAASAPRSAPRSASTSTSRTSSSRSRWATSSWPPATMSSTPPRSSATATASTPTCSRRSSSSV